MDQQQKARKPKGKPRVPDHLRPIIASVRLPRDVVAWVDGHGKSRTAVILGLIRSAQGARS